MGDLATRCGTSRFLRPPRHEHAYFDKLRSNKSNKRDALCKSHYPLPCNNTENNSHGQIDKKLPAIYTPRTFINMFTNSPSPVRTMCTNKPNLQGHSFLIVSFNLRLRLPTNYKFQPKSFCTNGMINPQHVHTKLHTHDSSPHPPTPIKYFKLLLSRITYRCGTFISL
jgi:hypothetical protein